MALGATRGYRAGTSPRQAPVSLPRFSMNDLNRTRSAPTCRPSKPNPLPTFSIRPAGCQFISTVTRVCVSSRVSKLTTRVGGSVGAAPGQTLIRVLHHDGGVEFAGYPAEADYPMGVGVIDLGDLLNPGHEVGKDVNCVHWLYTADSGAATSTEPVTIAISHLPSVEAVGVVAAVNCRAIRRWPSRTAGHLDGRSLS